MSSPEENKKLIRYLIEEGLNKGNFDLLDQHFTPDYRVHLAGNPVSPPPGPQAVKMVIGMWRAAFGDWHMTIEQLVAEGDFVANRFTTRGTHTGPLMGIPPTGKKMVVHGQELHRLANGKVAETWVCDDLPGILVQLGIVQPPPLARPQGPPGRPA
ncbi:MAG TPA: ester cyclase [Gemmataceae bacterium]|jgi:predicted ester cyclase|nr:ester cyclase [Gemmataceae bacterium]